MSSIDHDHESEPADVPAEQIAVDGKTGSDTEPEDLLKSEILAKDGPDTPHHARSNSVKKPTTFKAVSVTKNFLAKAGVPSAAGAKTNGETTPTTPGNTMPPAPRPRLVAKAASGTPGSGPNKASLGSKNGASGPDPMQVWNRNRAAPQPAQKHFTDEELKQQYGIHLATRLQADSEGKEAKWADIDDDEDDWAPEAIEWNDGTKIDLTANNAATTAAEQAAAEEEKKRQEEEAKAKNLSQNPPTTVGPNATILKPRSTAQPKTGGLVLKTPSEKPSLVSKPTAPTPVRSPWAALPPVDKVPPVAINPDIPGSATRPQGYDAYSNAPAQQPQQPPTPAMEIAADSFSRNRGDGPNGHPGQLFNAQSGRYEPANTGRRGSVRKDQNFRPPSLLQRGSAHDTRAPAGSSEGNQGRSNQQEPNSWAQRRPSNVSGDGSARRNSIINGLPNGTPDERRGSQQSQALQSPAITGQTSIPRDGSPALSQSSTQSPAVQHAQLANYQSASGPQKPSAVDIITQQKQTMKEKRELAIKRKQEEEAREEAAKKERIRLKMEALGMPPLEDKKDTSKKEIQKSIEKRPTESLNIEEEKVENPSTDQKPNHIPPQPPQEGATRISKSPPKPPQPDASGAPQQYGMMKVHGAASTSLHQPDSDRVAVEKLRSQPPVSKVSPPGLQPKPAHSDRVPSPLVNGIQTPEQGLEKAQEILVQHQIREQPRQQPWNQVPNDQKLLVGPGWNSQPVTREASSTHNSVWGAPSSRSLGNGAFDRSVQRPQSRQQDQYASPPLAPIGPPKHLQPARDHQRSHVGGDDTKTAEDFQTIPPFPPADARTSARGPDLVGRHLGAESQTTTTPFVNGLPPRSSMNQGEPLARSQDQQKSKLAAWGNFHASSLQEEAVKKHQLAASLAEEARQGIRNEAPQLPVVNETWKQVKVDHHSTQRSIIGIERGQITHDQAATGHQLNAEFRNSSFVSSLSMGSAAPAGIGRGSRFFPIHPAPFTPGHRRGSSPPPPDAEGHPAFLRDYAVPRVSLPLVGPRPKPTVKLPPSMPSPAQSPRLADAQTVGLRSASQPLVSNPSWQDRFNGLLGVKKVSPEKVFAHPVEPIVTSVSSASNKLGSAFSASKQPLTNLAMDSPAVSVSLPLPGLSNSLLGFKAESRNVDDEEELFIPESGSLPVTRLPPKEKAAPWGAINIPKRGSQKPTRLSKEVEPASKEDLLFAAMVVNGKPLIFINLDGMPQGKSRPLTSSLNKLNNVPHDEPHFEPQQQRPRNFSGGTRPSQVKNFKGRQSMGNAGGTTSPRTVSGTQHSKNAHPHNNSHMPNRMSSAVGAVGGWDSSHAR